MSTDDEEHSTDTPTITRHSTGYGPRSSNRPCFNGNDAGFELWEAKCLGHLRIQRMHDAILPPADGGVDTGSLCPTRNAEAYAELCLSLDDRSLSLIIRDAKNDGRAALKILRDHYLSASETRVIGLYTELTTMRKEATETLTDYIIRGETAAALLKNVGETVSDNLLIAMVLKGLPANFKSFVTVTTQRKEPHTLASFKIALRTHEETMRSCDLTDDSVMAMTASDVKCFQCGRMGHKQFDCKSKPGTADAKKKRWCEHCKSSTHDTYYCRRKSRGKKVGATAKSVIDQSGSSVVFKLSVDQRDSMGDCVNSLLVDTGATTHIVTDRAKFTEFQEGFDPDRHFIELADGSRANSLAQGRGKAKVSLVDSKGVIRETVLENALYVPSFKQDIFSVQCATEKGASVEFKCNSAELKCRNGMSFEIQKCGQLYFLNSVVTDKKTNRSLQEWHEVLGHCNTKDVLNLETVVEGMGITNKNVSDCDTCIRGKMTNDRSRVPDAKATRPLDLVHSDLAGPMDPTSREGFRYTLGFTDDFSGLVNTYFLKSKSDTTEATKQYLADIAPYGSIKRLRSDNGGEFLSGEFKKVMIDNKIKHETSAPRSPHQNGTAERQWRTVFDMARCMLLESNIPKYLWNYAVLAARYIRNRCYNPRLGKTPLEAFTGKRPNISNMHVFGGKCFAYVDDTKKLDARSEEGVFIGYDKNSPAYLVYFPVENKIKKVRHVKFISKAHVAQQEVDVQEIEIEVVEPVKSEAIKPERVEIESRETLVDRDRRYPSRQHNRPKALDDYKLYSVDSPTVDYCYRVGFVPMTYRDAMTCDDSSNWQTAMDSEMESLTENKTFEVTELPKGKNKIGGRWVYATKSDVDGNVKFKARYVAKGYSQKENVDYNETYSPTAHMTSIRMLTQTIVDQDMVVHQMDVKTAYLNAPIDCELYVEPPEGYTEHGRQVWKLNKSLYGLKQSGRNWNNLLNSHLQEDKFEQSDVDPCMYCRIDEKGKVILIFYVDDIIIAASDLDLLNSVKKSLSDRFQMKDLGELKWFLGIEFKKTQGTIVMSQRQYCEKVLARFGMTDCKPRKTTCDDGLDKEPDTSARLDDPKSYREIVGSLIYAMTATRPDLSYVVTKLSQKMSDPTERDLSVAKGVLRYLKGTLDYTLTFKRGDKVQIQGYCDSDWASSYSDRKSISAYVYQLHSNSGLISWKSKKQNIVALSSCEAEYIALSACVQEGLYLKKLITVLYEQDDMYPSVKIGVDNQGAIALAKNPVHQQRSKHIDVRYHFLRNSVLDGTMELYYVPSNENVADVSTKPVTQHKMVELLKY
jgi:hypothetical protein